MEDNTMDIQEYSEWEDMWYWKLDGMEKGKRRSGGQVQVWKSVWKCGKLGKNVEKYVEKCGIETR